MWLIQITARQCQIVLENVPHAISNLVPITCFLPVKSALSVLSAGAKLITHQIAAVLVARMDTGGQMDNAILAIIYIAMFAKMINQLAKNVLLTMAYHLQPALVVLNQCA